MSDPKPPDVPGHRLVSVLGKGATSTVWAADDTSGRRVAVKVPHSPVRAARASTTAEHQALLAVRHEHLVALRSVVPLPEGRDALVFDLVRGVSLRALVTARGHLRPGEVVTVLTPVCEALAAVHKAGVLHGDISASNVTVTPDGRPMLLDLGAARIAGADCDEVCATAGFAAPEVRDGAIPSEASDVYALGALAWFCATGNGAPDTLLRLDPEVVESHVGPELAPVIAACIDPDPEERPSSATLPRLFYDAAPADAVEVVMGADSASALTHRLRAQARDERPRHAHEPPPGRALLALRRSATSVRRLVGAARRVRWSAASSVRRSVPGAVVAAVALVAGAAWAVAAWHAPAPGSAAATSPVGTAASAVTPRVPPPSAAASATATPTSTARAVAAPGVPTRSNSNARRDLLRSPGAPASAPAAVLQALSDARSDALVRRDVRALGGVHREGSPSWDADRRLLATLRESGTTWLGLRLEVAEAAHLTSTPTSATVRARVDWTAYTAVSADGSRVKRPAERGQVLDFGLVRVDDGWRIESISRAPAS